MFDCVKNSKLEQIMSGRHKIKKLNGKILINRDPQIFQILLNYIGNNLQKPVFRNNYEEDQFVKELQHWEIKEQTELTRQLKDLFE